MTKVLLIVPTFNYKGAYPSFLSVSDFPSGFAYIASALKEAGHDVTGLNLNNITDYSSAQYMVATEIRKALENKPDLIGTGGLCIDYAFIKDAIAVIRTLAPDVPIVLGGGIINHDAEFIFNLLKPDFAIVGEAEWTIVKLANALENGRDFDSIDNLWYWDELGDN